jgi:hypothetical protein
MDRKEIVKLLGEHFCIKPKYLGAPNFAYQVGEFTIDKEGKIVSKAGEEVKLEDILNVEEETTIEIAFPLEGHNFRTLTNLINMIYSRHALIKKALGIEGDLMEEDFIETLNSSEIKTLEDLLKIAGRFRSNEIKFEEDKITFKNIKIDPKVAAEFLALLIKKAKELKYASAKPINTDNEKYTFRTWLMRLGMIGDEYKATRKVLLQNLTGNTAFRKSGENHEA